MVQQVMKKNRTADINPNWNLMRRGSATGFHPVNISKLAFFTKEKFPARAVKVSRGITINTRASARSFT